MECSFCNRAQEDVSLLIAGPPPNFICDECAITVAKGLLAAGKTSGTHIFTCSFCASQKTGPFGGVMESEARICKACTTVCLGIVEKQLDSQQHKSVIKAYKEKILATSKTVEDYLLTTNAT